MSKRPRAHIIEDLARMQLHQAFSSVGWASEDIDQDYGEDVLVRIFENDTATPWSFFVQSKATDDIDRYAVEGQNCISFPIQSDHIEHWGRFWEPVVLAIFDTKTEITYWEVIQTYLEAMKDSGQGKIRKSISVRVPTANMLDAEGLNRIRNRAKNRFRRFEDQREGASILTDALSQEWGVNIEYAPETGILMLPKGEFLKAPCGGQTLTAFGRTAAILESMKKKYGIDHRETLNDSLDLMLQITTAYENGATLRIQDKDGIVIDEWKTLEELLHYASRKSEIDDN